MVDAPEPLCFKGSPFWEEDCFDAFLPKKKGFINDFVLSLRGQEVPVAFSLWSSLVALSTCLKRETWLKWAEDPLYANLYLIIVAPAGMAKKSVPINQAVLAVDTIADYVNDPNVLIRKQMNIFRDKITGEAIFKFLARKMRPLHVPLVDSRGKPLHDENGPVTYTRCAEVLLVAPELGTMLSQAKYNTDLVTTLTKLYDTESTFESATKISGQSRLQRPYACLLGGTTPSALRESIPKTAVEEGFLSRLVLCYQPQAASLFHRPHSNLINIPRKEIASRLAWITEHTAGQWDLTPDADAFHEKWYKNFHTKFDSNRFHASQKSRFGVHILKTALLFKAQCYEDHREKKNRLIDIEVLGEATRLVEATMASAVPLIEETEANPFQRQRLRILNYIREKGRVTRKTLLQNAHLSASEATAIVSELFQAGEILTKENTAPTFDIREEYLCVGRRGRKK